MSMPEQRFRSGRGTGSSASARCHLSPSKSPSAPRLLHWPKFFRLKARRGYKLAVQVTYNELGDLYLDKLNKHHLTRNLVHRLERLGYTVTLEEKAAEGIFIAVCPATTIPCRSYKS